MPPAENGMFELLPSPAPFSALMVVKDDALNADVLAVGVLKMGGRLILLNELTIDMSVILNVGMREERWMLSGQREAGYLIRCLVCEEKKCTPN